MDGDLQWLQAVMHSDKPQTRDNPSTPPLVLAARRWLDLDLARFDFVPIGAERCPARLGIRFEHGAPGIFVCVAVYLRSCISFRNITTKGREEEMPINARAGAHLSA